MRTAIKIPKQSYQFVRNSSVFSSLPRSFLRPISTLPSTTPPSTSPTLPSRSRVDKFRPLVSISRFRLSGPQLSLLDLETERARVNASRLGTVEECREKNKARIGVGGNSAIDTSDLVLMLGVVGNELGFDRDQKHHDILAIHLSSKAEKELLRDQVSMLTDAGCRLILIPESDLSPEWISELEGKTKGMSQILFLNPEESMKDFAKRALDVASKLPAIDPNLHDASDYDVMLKSNTMDYANFQRRMASRIAVDGGYPRLLNEIKGEKIVLVIGGAGPVASAICTNQLAKLGVLCVHYSVSSAPSKIGDVLGEGLSCVPRYINADRMLRSLFNGADMKTIIPCNTFHFLLKEVFTDPDNQVIDIRDAVARILSDSPSGKVILLGTKATVFGAEGLGEGLYDQILTDAGCQIIKPTPQQQDIITDAINTAKAGKMKKAREMVNGVVSEIRAIYGGEAVAGLLCTDLPIAYTPNQIATFRGFSSINALVQMTRDVVFGKVSTTKSQEDQEPLAHAQHTAIKLKPATDGVQK
jgi:aspartate/glutamate racemase